MLLGSFGFAAANGGKLPYFVFYAILLLTCIPFAWSFIIFRNLDFSQYAEVSQAYVGDAIEINIVAHNRSLLPVPYVEVRNEMIKGIAGYMPGHRVLSIMPLGSKAMPEKVNCKYRGIYTFGPVVTDISDVFGMFTWNKKVSLRGVLTIYPRVAKLQNFCIKPMQTYGAITIKQKANEDYSSISDIRKYYPGDSFKRIHWKISARKGMLYVKNFDMSGSAGACIFLDMYRGGYNGVYRADMEEKSVECAAAIVYYTLSRNINTLQYVNSEKTVYTGGRDPKEFKKFMNSYVTVKSDGTTHLAEFIESKVRFLTRGSSIILITPLVDERLSGGILQLKDMGFEAIVVYIKEGDMDEKISQLFADCGIKLYKLSMGDDVKTSLEG